MQRHEVTDDEHFRVSGQRARGVHDDPPCSVHGRIALYWAIGRPLETQQRLVDEASRVVGLHDGERQIGFCRAVTDGVSFAYLADVYVLPEYRRRGLGERLLRHMIDEGPYKDRRWLLHTADMHALYRKVGFTEPSDRLMERRPDV
jgi:ribosomal protein S18 acetylase RimI-like enzyme